MNQSTEKYYVYRHIRLDKNEPFYIGMGSRDIKQIDYNYFLRAHSVQRRNKYWNNIVAKTNYKVEIIYLSDNKEEILQKEVEFISIYKRTSEGGSLTNLTTGGEFTTVSKEVIEEIVKTKKEKGIYQKVAKINSLKLRGNKNGLGANHSQSQKKIYAYDLEGNFIKEFSSVISFRKAYKIGNGAFSRVKHSGRPVKGIRYFYDFRGEKINSTTEKYYPNQTKVLLVEENKEFKSLTEAAKYVNATIAGIRLSIEQKRIFKNKFTFIYLEKENPKETRINKHKRKISVSNKNFYKEFSSIKEAGDYLKIQNLDSYLRKGRKNKKGYIFKYLK